MTSRLAVVGLDPSTSATGVAHADGTTSTIVLRKPKGKVTANARADRLEELRQGLLDVLDWPAGHGPPARLAVVEGYSLGGARGYAAAYLAEAGGIARLVARSLGAHLLEVPPSTLHLYATGNGKATKDDMVAAARAHGGRPDNADEADAWWLRRVGLAAAHPPGDVEDPPEFAAVRAPIVAQFREALLCAAFS